MESLCIRHTVSSHKLNFTQLKVEVLTSQHHYWCWLQHALWTLKYPMGWAHFFQIVFLITGHVDLPTIWYADGNAYDCVMAYMYAVCVYLSLSLFMYTYIYIYTNLSLSLFIYIYIYVCIQRASNNKTIYIYIYTYVHMHIHICICIYTNICYTYTYIYIYIYIYAHIIYLSL